MALIAAGCAAAPSYVELTPADIASRITVTGDKLDGYRTADSKALRPSWGQTGISSQVYFSATTFDDARPPVVHVVFVTRASRDWLFPQALNFGEPLRSIPVRRTDSDAACSASSCTHIEVAAAQLTDADVRYLLAPSTPESVDVRLKTRGDDVDRTVRKAELAATLKAVEILDRYR